MQKAFKFILVAVGAIALGLLVVNLANAQEQPGPIPPEPTAAEFKREIAEKDLQIAQLKVQLNQTQAQLVQLLGRQAQAELTAAQKAAQDAGPKPGKAN